MSPSIRRAMLERLRTHPATLRDLARELGLREGDVAEHLEHARRSLPSTEELSESSAACLSCGFEFRKRDRLTSPGRCPRCRSERIRPAQFRVASRS